MTSIKNSEDDKKNIHSMTELKYLKTFVKPFLGIKDLKKKNVVENSLKRISILKKSFFKLNKKQIPRKSRPESRDYAARRNFGIFKIRYFGLKFIYQF